MSNRVLIPIVFLLAGSLSQAQIFAVHFKDEKDIKKYKANITYVDGEAVVVGEAYSGIRYDPDSRTLGFEPDLKNELLVADPSDPLKVPYKFDKNGEKVPRKKKYVVGIDGKKIRNITVLIRDDTLAGLAAEYENRLDRLDDLFEDRDDFEKGGELWFIAQQRVVTHYEKLQKWLASTAFPEAAEKLDKEIGKERKVLLKGGADARVKRAIESVHSVPTPRSLIDASQKLTDGRLRFKVQESQHVRITYQDNLSDSRISDLLVFGEKLIEAYRNEFVDLHRGEDFDDQIPDSLFQEFWFGPDDLKLHEMFAVEHYGVGWGEDHKAERLAATGSRWRGVGTLVSVDYWKNNGNLDLEGVVSHGLGHTLASLHFANGGDVPDWLAEGSGYYCSFEFLGRNTVTCKEFRDARYLGPDPGEEGDKTVQEGLRDYLNKLAVNEGPTLEQLTLKTLYNMQDPDLATSWSLFDYVAREQGKDGQLWLRALCNAPREREGKVNVNKWREISEEIYAHRERKENESRDILKRVDGWWRDYALGGQDKSGNPRKRR